MSRDQIHHLNHEISKVLMRDPTEARRRILELLVSNGGGTAQTHRDLGISRRYLRHLMERLDLLAENEEIRRRAKARFRLPPLEGACRSTG